MYGRSRLKLDLVNSLALFLILFGFLSCVASFMAFQYFTQEMEKYDIGGELTRVQENLDEASIALQAGSASMEEVNRLLLKSANTTRDAGKKLDVEIPYVHKKQVTQELVEDKLTPLHDASVAMLQAGSELEALAGAVKTSSSSAKAVSTRLGETTGEIKEIKAKYEAVRGLLRTVSVFLFVWFFALGASLFLLGMAILRLNSMATFKYR